MTTDSAQTVQDDTSGPSASSVIPVPRRREDTLLERNQRRTWDLEPVKCNLCEAVSPRVLFTNDSHGFGLRTVACERCGLVYLDPRPTASEYRRFYAGLYEQLFPNGGTPGRFADFAASQRLSWYEEFLTPGSRLLEVGPGGGAFLAAVRDNIPGTTIAGVEPSPLAVDACRLKGLEVVQGYLEDLPGVECFDVVAAFHVLEHSLDPSAMLTEISRRLVPGGYFLVEVPNICGKWKGLGMIHIAHPYQYTPRTLTALLEKTGFEVRQMEEMEQHGFECSFRIVARKQLKAAGSWETSLPLDRPDHLSLLFAERLSNWRWELFCFKTKRNLLRMLGPTVTRALKGKIRWAVFQISRHFNLNGRIRGRGTSNGE